MNIALFAINAFCLFIISITMLARANDLRVKPQMRWKVRLLGFVMAGCAPVGHVGLQWALKEWPSPYEVIFSAGLMFVFVTTPYLPPWWKWISGKDETPPQWSDDRRKVTP